jgi:hypothetical protein
MSNRQAIDTIKGYFYQFDYTIKQILEQRDVDNEITIEGVEDVDVKTATEVTAIQCKYYEKTEYNHSVMAEPIRLMLKDFKERKDLGKETVKYKLYGHYNNGQHKLVLPLTIDFLKKHFLTYKENKVEIVFHNELGLSDKELEEFISILEVDINAKKYDEQMQEVLAYLSSLFECSSGEASFFYYNNCLRIIKELAAKDIFDKRKISKQHLIRTLRENKKHVFNDWYIAFIGKENYLKYLKKNYFTTLNTSPFARFFLIEIPTDTYKRQEVKEVLLLIIKNWSKTTRRDVSRFSPDILLFGIENKEFDELRLELYHEGVRINDGHSFAGSAFNPQEIIKSPLVDERCLKWVNNIELLDTVFSELKNSTKLVYQFYFGTPFYSNSRPDVNDINIQIELLTDIKSLI